MLPVAGKRDPRPIERGKRQGGLGDRKDWRRRRTHFLQEAGTLIETEIMAAFAPGSERLMAAGPMGRHKPAEPGLPEAAGPAARHLGRLAEFRHTRPRAALPAHSGQAR